MSRLVMVMENDKALRMIVDCYLKHCIIYICSENGKPDVDYGEIIWILLVYNVYKTYSCPFTMFTQRYVLIYLPKNVKPEIQHMRLHINY